MKKLSLIFHLLLLLCLFGPFLSYGQDEKELRPVSRTYAITNATIITAPGKKIEHATLIIKDGLISSVAAAGSPPSDAIIIKGDSLFVYAGFIDGLSHTGVTKSREEKTGDRPREPGNPTFERAGITPQTDVIPLLVPQEKSTEDMRSAGFTAAQVVPYGNMLPGNGAVILLGGSTVPKMVLTENSSLYAELTPAQGAYPTTVIGVMAKWRELYRQASNSLSYQSTYATNRTGLERPVTNRVLEAFYPVIEKKKPVLFKAEKMLDVYRVMELQSDLGFPLVLANVKEGWMLTDKIKASGASVFLSLDLPEDKKDDDKKDDDKKGDKKDKDRKDKEKSKDGDKEKDQEKDQEKAKEETDKKKEDKKDTIAKPKTAADIEKEGLDKRKVEVVAKYTSQAATYQKAGIRFGFSALTVKAKDIQSNLRKIIAAGLPEDEALAALTTYPAQILGLSDRLGTIDNGKIANLVITDKSYFNEKSTIRYVFVDGEIYKQEIKEPKKNSDTKIGLEGSWTLSADTPQGKSDTKLVFKKNGDVLTGSAAGNYITGTTDLKAIEFKEGHLRFSFSINVDGAIADVVVDVKVTGDTFKGTSVAGQFGTFDTTGKKDPKF